MHRDIKPANVMVDRHGVVKILDFGIARLGVTEAGPRGLLLGTLNYMSPEQVSGGRLDHRSDIFAAGPLFYELVSRRRAFPSRLEDGGWPSVWTSEPAALPLDVPPEVRKIVHRALERDPSRRFQECAEMREAILAVPLTSRR